MTIGQADHQPQGTHWMLRVAALRRVLPSIRTPALQWSMAVVVALALGLYLLFAIAWRPHWAPFLVLVALIPFVTMIVGDVRKLLLAVMLVELPLQLDVALYPDWQAQQYGAIGGLNVSVTTFCLVALYALWLVELLTKGTPVRHAWFCASLPLTAYLAAVALSVAAASAINLALFEIFLLFQSFLLFVYIIKSVRSRRDLLFIVTMLLIGLALEGAVMIGLRIIGHGVYVARISANIDTSGRVGGTIGSPNTAASYLTLLLAPALSVLLTPLKGCNRWLAALAFGLGAVALVLTSSRGGWFACTISVSILCLLALYRGWLSPKVFLILATIVVLLFSLLGPVVVTRLTADDAGAAASRASLARLAFRIIRDQPLLGVGVNNYAVTFRQYLTPEFTGEFVFWVVHNKYLLVWAETGLIGLMAFLWFLLAHLRRGWLVWMRRDHLLSPLALGFTVAIMGQMAHMFVDIFHSRPQVQTLWLVAALITAMWDMDSSTS